LRAAFFGRFKPLGLLWATTASRVSGLDWAILSRLRNVSSGLAGTLSKL